MQGNLWPGSASGGGGGSAASCVLGADAIPSSCMSAYPHSHGNLQGFMGMTPSPGHHHHHHHPPHHPGINSLYSLHSFPGGLGSPSLEAHEAEYKPAGLVALRMKAKDPGSLLSWPTWPRQCQHSIMHWLSQSISHSWLIQSLRCTHPPNVTHISVSNICTSQCGNTSLKKERHERERNSRKIF